MSRWIMLFAWRYANPSATWLMYYGKDQDPSLWRQRVHTYPTASGFGEATRFCEMGIDFPLT